MAQAKTVFVAYAVEDERQRDFFKGQSLSSRAPHAFIDMSANETYEEGWKDKVRTRIRRSDGVIALVSKNSLTSTGQMWEIACAREERKPIRGIWAYSRDRTELSGVITVTWTEKSVSEFIDSL